MVINKPKSALILEPEFYKPGSLERLQDAGITPVLKKISTKTKLVRHLAADHDSKAAYLAIFVRIGLGIDSDVLAAAGKGLHWVITPTTGLAHIDMSVARAQGVRVLSLKGETDFLKTIPSTAEMAWGLLIALIRKIPASHGDVMKGCWRRDSFCGWELSGKTLGIIGLGRLGSMMAGYGHAFGMRLIACDERDAAFSDLKNIPVGRRNLYRLLAESDVISLHLPLEERTVGILDAKCFAKIRPGAVFINTARGELVDEASMLKALEDGTLSGAALDVISGDSSWDSGIPEGNPLLAYARKHANLIITPHIGGYSLDAILKTRAYMVEKFCRNLEQKG